MSVQVVVVVEGEGGDEEVMVVEGRGEGGDGSGGWKKFVTEYMVEYFVLFAGAREKGSELFVCSAGRVGMCHAG